jgi:hypothetical protein
LGDGYLPSIAWAFEKISAMVEETSNTVTYTKHAKYKTVIPL